MTGLMADRNRAGDGRRRILKLQLLSLLPVTLAAIFNSGYQYLNGLAAAPASGGDDFRSRLASGLASSFENPGIYDYFAVGLAHLLPMLLVAMLVGGLWERIIAARCRRPIEPSFVLIALLFTLLMPGAAPFTHIAFGMSFAILLGKGIFGGDGKSFLSPALLGVAIVQVSFAGASGSHPLWSGVSGYAGSDAFAVFHRGGEAALAQADINLWSAFFGAIPGPMGTTSLLAVALGAALLLLTGVIAWRLLAAQFIGLIVIVTLVNWMGADTGIGALPAYWHLLLGSFAFGAVYLGCDPVASACTNPGRWIQGFLIAALVVLIRVANPIHPDAVIPALLLASILAPLIDHAVIAWNIRQRARRHV